MFTVHVDINYMYESKLYLLPNPTVGSKVDFYIN